MSEYPTYWLKDALWYGAAAINSLGWALRCLWWSVLSAADYVWYIKIRHESE